MSIRSIFGGQAPQYTLPPDAGNVGQQLEVTSNGVDWVDAAAYPGYDLPTPIGTGGQLISVNTGATALEWVTPVPPPSDYPSMFQLQFNENAGTGVFAPSTFQAQKIPLVGGKFLIRLAFSQVGTTTPLSSGSQVIIATLPAGYEGPGTAQAAGVTGVTTASTSAPGVMQVNGSSLILQVLENLGATGATIAAGNILYISA